MVTLNSLQQATYKINQEAKGHHQCELVGESIGTSPKNSARKGYNAKGHKALF
jgi:hypothetical protein